MTLRRLTALEIGKVEEEGRILKQKITELKELLGSEQAIRETVAREAREVADSLGNPRRTVVSFFVFLLAFQMTAYHRMSCLSESCTELKS